MKYIVMQRKIGDMIQEIPIIFPAQLVHKHVAQALLKLPGNPYNFINKVASAGEVTFDNDSITCYGESETLNIKSRGLEDVELIEMIDYGGGIK